MATDPVASRTYAAVPAAATVQGRCCRDVAHRTRKQAGHCYLVRLAAQPRPGMIISPLGPWAWAPDQDAVAIWIEPESAPGEPCRVLTHHRAGKSAYVLRGEESRPPS